MPFKFGMSMDMGLLNDEHVVPTTVLVTDDTDDPLTADDDDTNFLIED